MAKEFYVQQNSFHVMSKYLEILTIWHFKRVVPRSCSPYQGGKYLCQQAVLGDMPNKASKRICTSNVMVSADPLSFAPSTLPAMKNLDNKEEDPDTRNQQRKDIS